MAEESRAELTAAAAPVDDTRRFFFVNVVWGAQYVDRFTDFSIPTLLAPNNIPALPNRHVSEFVVVTPRADGKRIRESAIFPSLSRLIPVTFVDLALGGDHKYSDMNRGHALAVEHVAGRGYCVFLAPDALVSDGMMRRLYELAVQGRRVVAGFGPRVDEVGVLRELTSRPEYRKGEPIVLEPRRLVDLTMRHLHSDTAHHFANSRYFPHMPYACIWPGPRGDGMLVRALNLHPYLFDTTLMPAGERLDPATMTVDWSVLPRYVTDWNEFYVEKDSDNFCIVGTTPMGVRDEPDIENRLSAEQLSLWLLRHRYSVINRNSFLYPIAFHARPLGPEWAALAESTHEFAQDVLDPAGAVRAMTLGGETPAVTGRRHAEIEVGHASVGTKPVPFYYSFAVWGDKYVDYLCRFGLASMLSPRNLPSLPNNGVSTVVIATTPRDEQKIRATEIFRLVSKLVTVEFAELPARGSLPTAAQHEKKYNLLSAGHSIGADRAAGRGCAVFLGPDAIYSDGMFSRLYELALAGQEVVVGMGIRVNEEMLIPELEADHSLRPGHPLAIPSRRLVGLMLRHMHEDIRVQRWFSPIFPRIPYLCMWDVGGGDGVLVRSFTLHPYLVDYRNVHGIRPRPIDVSAVDASFIVNCLIPWDKVYQIRDTDEAMVLSLTSMHHCDYVAEYTADPFGSLASSSRRHDISMIHRAYFMNAIKMHIGDLDDRWEQLERETLRIAYSILGSAPAHVGASPEAALPERVNAALSTEGIGISGKLALRFALRKILRRLGLRPRRPA